MEGKRSVSKWIFVAVVLLGLSFLAVSPSQATPAKFDIPGDFPGDFRIDFLGTDFKLGGTSTGSLSTGSVVDFSVGAETSSGSGVYDITVSPAGFDFVGFQPINGMDFDVYGAGVGTGTFDTSTGDWSLDMPTLFVNYYVDSNGDVNAWGTREDFHLTTINILVPSDGTNPEYWTTTASPMVIDETVSEPWGDLNLVVGDLVDHSNDLTLTYDWNLINSIASGYDFWEIDQNQFAGIQYEFDIYGNDPLITAVPEPSSILLLATGLAGLVQIRRRIK